MKNEVRFSLCVAATWTLLTAAAASAQSLSDRESAADQTARSSTNFCAPIQPFYYEIGNETAMQYAASVGGGPTYKGSSTLNIASASKWMYAAYVVQREAGQLSSQDLTYLRMLSGYTSFSSCLGTATVDRCLASGTNGVLTPANEGAFYYGGGHDEEYADLLGLGPSGDADLTTEIKSQLGTHHTFTYIEPELSGGVQTSASDYGAFLREILSGSLKMKDFLGAHPVCTNPETCPGGSAIHTPIPSNESWTYSIGHWVESDPVVGDGAFSSPGADGFYPWIDATKTWYGIIARNAGQGSFYSSVECGRLIRKAWISGIAQQ